MSSSTPDTSKVKSNTRSLFKPPSGGDLTLRSSDGVDFPVHSTILKLASSVFDDMISTGTTKDTIELAENAVDVLYLLRFIYPNRFPVAISLEELPSCLLVAQKYDIQGALEIIDELIAMDGSPHKPISSDPIRAYQFAVQFNLTKTKIAAAPSITTDQVDFCDLNKLPELSRTYSSLKLIRMMNLQAMRSKVLFDTLFDVKHEPMLPTDENFFYDISCGLCWSRERLTKSETKGYKKFPTTWSLAWARVAYERLLVSSIDRSQFLFQATILQKLADDDHVCQRCISRFEESESYRTSFESWVGDVKKSLEMQLERLELLYVI